MEDQQSKIELKTLIDATEALLGIFSTDDLKPTYNGYLSFIHHCAEQIGPEDDIPYFVFKLFCDIGYKDRMDSIGITQKVTAEYIDDGGFDEEKETAALSELATSMIVFNKNHIDSYHIKSL